MATDHDFELTNKPVYPDNSGLNQCSTFLLEYLTADFIRPIPPKTTHHKPEFRKKQHAQTATLSTFFQQLKIQHIEVFDVDPPHR